MTLDPLQIISVLLEDDFKLASQMTKIPFKKQDCDTLVTKYFVLISCEDEIFISFCLNSCSLYDASLYTNFLTTILQHKLVPYIEHYIDLKRGMIMFGERAYQENSDNINRLKGIKMCPVCEKYYPLEMFPDDNGFCIVCNKITLNKSTYH